MFLNMQWLQVFFLVVLSFGVSSVTSKMRILVVMVPRAVYDSDNNPLGGK